MLLAQILLDTNIRLAGEQLSYMELRPFFDQSIDDINARLNTKFPAFSDLPQEVNEYNAFPDMYIRSVVIPGAAFRYYIMDEEGMEVAPKYEEDFYKGLFYMERDYLALVPEEYIASDEHGRIYMPEEKAEGLCIDGYSFFL